MTDSDPRRAQLDGLIKRRDTLTTKKGRVEGQLEEARKALTTVEAECTKRKVEPGQLGAAIGRLETRYDTAVKALETDIKGAESALSPFLEEPDED